MNIKYLKEKYQKEQNPVIGFVEDMLKLFLLDLKAQSNLSMTWEPSMSHGIMVNHLD